MKRLFKPFHKRIGATPAQGRKLFKQNLLILAICAVAVSSLATAYAILNTTLFVNGEVTIQEGQLVRIATVAPEEPSTSCGYANYPPTWTSTSFNVDGMLPELDCVLVFDITVKNETDDIIYIEQIVEDSFNNAANIEYSFSITPSTPGSVVPAQNKLDFNIKFRYKSGVANLPAMTSFVASFNLVFEKVTPPILAVTNDRRNFEVYRGNTATPPTSLYNRVAAVDEMDGNITSQIVKTCVSSDNQAVTCPTAWADLTRGDYTITFNVTNSLGLSAVPIKFNVNLWDFIKIAEGNLHVLALGSNGKVWAWGSGGSGALGLGNTNNQSSPVQITSLSSIIDIAADDQTSFAVSSSGSLYAWGQGGSYRLGTNSASNQTSPVQITPPAGKKYVAVSSIAANGLALTNTGEVYSWGQCYYGACGQAGGGTRQVPTLVSGLSNIVKISAGHSNGGAIDSSGNLWMWGSNYYGQLGVGDNGAVTGNSHGSITGGTNGNAPQMWNDFTNVKTFCYGHAHAIAIKNDGSVWVWGYGSNGRIGNGSAATNQFTPLELTSISGSGRTCYANEYHSQVVTESNVLYAWGRNTNYEIGHISGDVAVNSPYLVAVGSIIAQSSIGTTSSHAIITDNITVRGWGANGSGQIGNGSSTNPIPTWVVWNFTVPAIVQW
jgi:alpha-tubulin suppressor-like RCC1 family protein